ncbi:hypothetical protein JQ612_17700 [Bradyrhizobium manausense]|uniref:hypothetical protein n=1 Tax=Bradyrhizobium manausense TaxID=989370 RepID=UPI001BABF436|nr:hypothetical protein [Bradyrhizobium manausense]MBR0691373.1 hypothetical protein [Bradyrhizobium manausense]MBR0725298.1 hypothetical protein [Bradyrhizobium manausense]MBR0835026.1 hypothetical protein [Bradyrhizobium manausense]
MRCFTLCLIGLLAGAAPALAQVDTRQPNGPVDLRVDGRPNKRVGLPPSAADRGNGTRENPIYESDCAEVEQLNPNARQRYQARVRRACGY